MNNAKNNLFFLLMLFLTAVSCGKKTNMIQDYLNAGNVILFDNVKYNLAWSSHPSANYFEQEYIPENDTLEKFRKLILFEVLDNTRIKDAVSAKISELKKMKESDPMVNYDVFEKDGEIMIDFLLSKNLPGGSDQEIAERNVYRYKSITENGKDEVLLFGVSERSYGDDIERFLLSLKEKRFELPDAVSAFAIPEIRISKKD